MGASSRSPPAVLKLTLKAHLSLINKLSRRFRPSIVIVVVPVFIVTSILLTIRQNSSKKVFKSTLKRTYYNGLLSCDANCTNFLYSYSIKSILGNLFQGVEYRKCAPLLFSNISLLTKSY